MSNSNNPLSKYFRRAELYLPLPSGGKFWEEGSIEMPPNEEIAVLSMSGADDLAMKNADGLMNGSTTVEIIQSCCPSIKNAWKTPNIDIDSIMIAIRIATYGSTMDFEGKCSKCGEVSSYGIDLRWVLENISLPNFEQPIEIDDGVFAYLKPDTFDRINKNRIEAFQQQRSIKAITESNANEEDKIEQIRRDLINLTKLTAEKIASQIDKIVTSDGVNVNEKVYIQEFVENANKNVYENLLNGIKAVNAQYKLPTTKTKCPECGNEETRSFNFEPASFFGKGS